MDYFIADPGTEAERVETTCKMHYAYSDVFVGIVHRHFLPTAQR